METTLGIRWPSRSYFSGWTQADQPRAAGTHGDSDLPQDVLGERQAFLDHHLVELVQGRVHQLHADPHVALREVGGDTGSLQATLRQ